VTVDEFISKWENCSGSERANYAVFLTELANLLGVEAPGPNDDYRIDRPAPGGAAAGGTGFIDLYKRGCFILEAKQSKQVCELPTLPGLEDISTAQSGAKYDDLMRRAFRQARRYAQSLTQPPWPPFIIVLDVGRAFEIYFDYGGNGRDYRFFPDRLSYRVPLKALRDPAIQQRLRAIWTDPKSIDPRFQSADVTREVAKRLASVSQYIEEGLKPKLAGKTPRERSEEIEEAALFLMRILFCMFAEDIGLLPKEKFKQFLRRAESNDKLFQIQLADLWQKMGAPNIEPRFAHAVEEEVKYFNGGLFSETARTYPLGGFVIHDLYKAARQNWRKVEPAIFGTLLEQALSPEERARLGAHYTPRPYVETLVRATIMDVLESEWADVEEKIAALQESLPPSAREASGASAPKGESAATLALAFHDRLASTRVLDPACGTGNFLYVSMELMQALEARVIETIQTLGSDAEPKVGPHQFYGLEKNPRAAKIAELVLWIGWLRNRLHDDPDSVPEPVLAESANINFGKHGGYDAVLKMNELGQPDLESPMIPDWPEAEFIVGNPPFIGGKDLREEQGSAYVEALRKANSRVNASADYVMQWWARAAHALAAKDTPFVRFGFVTTNSITQKLSRKVVASYLADGEISLAMAIPDHPWIKKAKEERSKAKGSAREKKKKGPAAVRIAMTVAQRGQHDGRLFLVKDEKALDTDEPQVEYHGAVSGRINSDLTIGADVTATEPLQANEGICSPGMKLHGRGFVVTPRVASDLGLGKRDGLDDHILPYLNGRDLLHRPRGVMVIDFFGLEESTLMDSFPEAYDHLLRTVKVEREKPKKSGEDRVVSYAERWWEFGVPRQGLREMIKGLSRFIATVETAKHRTFQFFDAATVPDNKLTIIASDNGFVIGVLSSFAHLTWADRNKGRLESRPVYVKTTCFDPFPFPDPPSDMRQLIADLGDRLDATRKAALAETDKLTMTELYNLREKLRSGMPMDEKEQRRATKARAAIVNRLHEQLDAAVADAYGWGEEWRLGELGPSEIVARLVALNHERAAEEKAGKVRWLRPDYQEPRFGAKTR
jgi:hypothetical protein